MTNIHSYNMHIVCMHIKPTINLVNRTLFYTNTRRRRSAQCEYRSHTINQKAREKESQDGMKWYECFRFDDDGHATHSCVQNLLIVFAGWNGIIPANQEQRVSMIIIISCKSGNGKRRIRNRNTCITCLG